MLVIACNARDTRIERCGDNYLITLPESSKVAIDSVRRRPFIQVIDSVDVSISSKGTILFNRKLDRKSVSNEGIGTSEKDTTPNRSRIRSSRDNRE